MTSPFYAMLNIRSDDPIPPSTKQLYTVVFHAVHGAARISREAAIQRRPKYLPFTKKMPRDDWAQQKTWSVFYNTDETTTVGDLNGYRTRLANYLQSDECSADNDWLSSLCRECGIDVVQFRTFWFEKMNYAGKRPMHPVYPEKATKTLIISDDSSSHSSDASSIDESERERRIAKEKASVFNFFNQFGNIDWNEYCVFMKQLLLSDGYARSMEKLKWLPEIHVPLAQQLWETNASLFTSYTDFITSSFFDGIFYSRIHCPFLEKAMKCRFSIDLQSSSEEIIEDDERDNDLEEVDEEEEERDNDLEEKPIDSESNQEESDMQTPNIPIVRLRVSTAQMQILHIEQNGIRMATNRNYANMGVVPPFPPIYANK